MGPSGVISELPGGASVEFTDALGASRVRRARRSSARSCCSVRPELLAGGRDHRGAHRDPKGWTGPLRDLHWVPRREADPEEDEVMPATLYERLGGIFAIAAVIDNFSDRLLKNPKIVDSNPDMHEW